MTQKKKREFTWSCNDCSTLLMEVTLKVKYRASHGSPNTLHLSRKNTRFHMWTRLGCEQKSLHESPVKEKI